MNPSRPARMRAKRMMMMEIQQKSAKLPKPKIQPSRNRSIKSGPGQADVVRRAMCKCDYPGCHKGFRRNEHLRRHKQTYHGEGPNRSSCEFCGKDQFNRQDNLNNHRKLHARPNSHNRGIGFIPAAVPVIEQEERSRKQRARWKPQIAEGTIEGKENSLQIARVPCLKTSDAQRK
ncbi:C2H2 type master regulator of conidiophore development brlA [Fusarium oxysporum f. sp. rapae]|uniref:C2H2 type master regulator of conidiophore development brlA n=1 Tax=Fusarium oxysporum f. sp. rapae TaxID=485398 RepID=A0A8J5TP46_FUSOX|nr:C2H2 type master regulator of conidiophore development brlA [Fusarium oxysporum f. sp. rapae]